MTGPQGAEPERSSSGEPAPTGPPPAADSRREPTPRAEDREATVAVPRGPGSVRPPAPDPGPGWATAPAGPAAPAAARQSRPPADAPADPQRTTVLPTGARPATADRPPGSRPTPPRPAAPRDQARPAPAPARQLNARSRRARLALRRIDPWSVFVLSLITSVFLGIALVVAAATLFAVLGSLGVNDSLNQLWAEVTGGSTADPLLTAGRIVGGAAVLAALNVVLLTLLATLGSLLYNLCASFTGGLELTLGERD